MHRDLEHPREPIALPGEEREVVVAELEVGRIQVAEVLQRVVEAEAPSAVRRGEPARVDAEAAEDAVGPLQVEAVGLRVAIDVVEMAVRLGVVLPQVPQDRRVVGIGMGADEVRAAVGQRRPRLGEGEVVVGQRLVQVGPEAERRAIRIRERRQPDPDAARPR